MLANLYRISRLVVLPDYQGLGLSSIMNEFLGELYNKEHKKLSIVTTHPGLIKQYIKSSKWKLNNFDSGVKVTHNFDKNLLSSRLKSSFQYIPLNYIENEWDI